MTHQNQVIFAYSNSVIYHCLQLRMNLVSIMYLVHRYGKVTFTIPMNNFLCFINLNLNLRNTSEYHLFEYHTRINHNNLHFISTLYAKQITFPTLKKITKSYNALGKYIISKADINTRDFILTLTFRFVILLQTPPYNTYDKG